MGNKWWEAEKWESCANLDFKGMYYYYVTKRGIPWCLTAEGKGTTFFKGSSKMMLS